jgi:signal transduction histidine kinase
VFATSKRTIENVFALAKQADVLIINECLKTQKALGNEDYLESILLNFISNSIRYKSTSRNAFVKLKSYVKDNWLVISIEDNGLGIDLERYGRKLFGLFKQFHDHPESRGVGLFMAKNQIEALGGKIEVISEVDKGTTFKLYFLHAK